jgi:hypothetical protein
MESGDANAQASTECMSRDMQQNRLSGAKMLEDLIERLRAFIERYESPDVLFGARPVEKPRALWVS